MAMQSVWLNGWYPEVSKSQRLAGMGRLRARRIGGWAAASRWRTDLQAGADLFKPESTVDIRDYRRARVGGGDSGRRPCAGAEVPQVADAIVRWEKVAQALSVHAVDIAGEPHGAAFFMARSD